MDKKIFRAPNIQTALAHIKEELGSDAMILSTRKVPKSPKDPYGKTMFEVEAGIPSTGDDKPKTPVLQEVKSLKSDLAEIKDILSVAGFGSGLQSILCNHFESVGVLASLLRCGVSERLAADLVQKAAADLDQSLDTVTQMKQLKKKRYGPLPESISHQKFFHPAQRVGTPPGGGLCGTDRCGKNHHHC